MFSLKFKLVFLLLVAFFRLISSECRQSYITTCDNFTDFKNYKDVESLSEVMIGAEHGTSNMTSVHLMETLNLSHYYKMTTLMIVRVINRLLLTYGYQCTYYRSPLKYMILYGNELGTIQAYQFPLVPLKKLSLVNNKINSVKSWAFRYYEIENIDLSDNFLEVVESGALPSTDATKIITIRNNSLTHIEPESFPSGLESLHLDRNKLRYIQDEVFEKLVNLRELSLSHNNFNKFPKISHLKKLVILDISSNAISTITEGTFKEMDDLKVIDLSNNDIESISVLDWIITPKKQPTLTISLAHNRLRHLNLANVTLQNQTMVLYGNPWDCNSWPQLKQNLTGHESKCDEEFLSSGSVPYCINYKAGGYYFISTMWEQDIDRLHKVVKNSEKQADCILAPNKYKWLYAISVGCVA